MPWQANTGGGSHPVTKGGLAEAVRGKPPIAIRKYQAERAVVPIADPRYHCEVLPKWGVSRSLCGGVGLGGGVEHTRPSFSKEERGVTFVDEVASSKGGLGGFEAVREVRTVDEAVAPSAAPDS